MPSPAPGGTATWACSRGDVRDRCALDCGRRPVRPCRWCGGRIERNLWLSRDLAEPTYAGRPWMLWTANSHWQTDAAEAPLRWVVARP